jgi:sirohydrochlorin ferrochelatase
VLRAVRDAVAAQLPVKVTLAWIEQDNPLLTDVMRDRTACAEDLPVPIVVPLLLSRGTHTSRDLPPEARGPLGPDPLLTRILLDRLRQARIAAGRPLVLAATGSSDPLGTLDVMTQAQMLETAWEAPVRAGFVTGEPSLAAAAQAASSASADGEQSRWSGPPAIVSYFLAPGRLPDSARAETEHLGTHPALIELVLTRYRGVAPVGVTRMGL